jgi:GDP-L-fucose synthase
MKKNAKIYVAGHTGLVGSNVLRILRAQGYRNIIVQTSRDLDLRNQNATNVFFKRERPEYVFLCAGKVGGIMANSTYAAEFIYDNLMIAANVINAAYQNKVKKLLNLGSSCIYPKFAPQPLKEEYLLTTTLEPTNEAYAVAKIAAIKLCRYYNEQYGTNYISVMPTNLYGPGDNFDLVNSHVLPALVRKFHLARLLTAGNFAGLTADFVVHGNAPAKRDHASMAKHLKQFGIEKGRVTLWGTGQVFREFLYIDDLAAACIFLMERYDCKDIGELINIGYGRDLKIRELAAHVQQVVGFPGQVQYDSTKPDGTPRKYLDTSRLFKLGWRPRITLEQGITRTYQWFKKQATGNLKRSQN